MTVSLLARRVALVLVAALIISIAVLPTRASAHGGPYELKVAHDGAGGFTVSARYTRDAHVVEAIMDAVVTAVAADGTTVGPVALISSNQGIGRWVTEEPILEEGEWTVTAKTTTPQLAQASIEVNVEPLAPPIEIESNDEAVMSDDPSVAAAPDGIGNNALLIVVVLGGLLVAGVAAVVVMIQLRNKRR
ncbi:hypothetical protein [Microbacterium marmarense]|uniref:CopC domain-containing protein n=1 Tax=Microbacterium marmarense TaxID=3122051 RepID=A0ABU8LXJ9_9MICO